MEFAAHQRLDPHVLHDLDLALEEVLANIISYGYADDRDVTRPRNVGLLEGIRSHGPVD
jgi:anti-sigma regulatory factor (Ser/Thr protein kinase)